MNCSKFMKNNFSCPYSLNKSKISVRIFYVLSVLIRYLNTFLISLHNSSYYRGNSFSSTLFSINRIYVNPIFSKSFFIINYLSEKEDGISAIILNVP